MRTLKLKIITCFSIFAMIFTACEQDVLIPNVIEQSSHEPTTPTLVQGDTPHACATYGESNELKKHYPSGHDENHPAKMKMKDIYDNYANNVNFKNNAQVYTVPVVFHAFWKDYQGTIYGDIQASQIDRAIEILNADFNQTNDQSFIPQNFLNIAGDSQIEFVLAEKDPNGVCLFEAGISRVESNFVFDGSQNIPCGSSYGYHMRDQFHWPTDKYLNIYLVDYISLDNDGDCSADSGSGSGYALLTADAAQYPNLDGIVLNYHYLGDTGEAVGNVFPSVISHEAGHWLGLNHTWGPGAFGACGNDGIGDTPQTSGNYSNDFPNYCSNGANNTCGSNDNVHNFMDYACESMFTDGQVGVMRGVLTSSLANRNNLWSASNLSAVMGCGGGSCATPSTSEITYTEHPTLIYLYANNYNGVSHQFRYRVNGGSWVNLPVTTSHYSTITNKQANSTYEVQLQLCGNNWSGTVTIGNGGCSTPSPAVSEITHTEHSSLIYVYAQNYNGINHQFRYRINGGSWVNLPATTSHYSTITNKQNCATYEVQLKVECSAWSGTKTITTSC